MPVGRQDCAWCISFWNQMTTDMKNKMKNILLPAVCLALLPLSPACTKDIDVNQDSAVKLNISGEDASKISFSDNYATLWNTGDELTVFYKNSTNSLWTYSGTDGAPSGEISCAGVLSKAENDKSVVLFPYSSDASLSSSVISFTVPAEQKTSSSSRALPLLAGISSTSDVKLHYASALVKVELTGYGDVKAVTLRGNDNETLSGPARIDLSGSAPVFSFTQEAAGKSIRTSAKDGGLLCAVKGNAVSVYSNAPAIRYGKGLTLTVEYASGSTQEILYSEPVELGDGQILNLKEVACMEMKTLTIDFTRTDFDSFYGISFPKLTTKVAEYVNKGTYNFKIDGATYPVTFKMTVEAAETYHYLVNTESPSYLRIKGNNSCISVPKPAGYSISGFSVTEGRTYGADSSHEIFLTSDVSSRSDAYSNRLGTSIKAPCTAGQVQTVEIGDTDPSKDYWLYVYAGGYAYIRALDFFFVRNN